MIIKNRFVNKYKAGFPLIISDALEQPTQIPVEGSIVDFTEYRGSFVCRGIIGLQNKGLGWIFTNNQNEQINADFFSRKIKEALEYRSKLFKSVSTNCFRVFNGEGDGIGGVTIDNFDGYYLINWYNKGIFKFKDEIISALEVFGNVKGVYQKKRFDASYDTDEKSFVKGIKAENPLIVKENNVKFAIHLEDGAMVGIFLDQREIRQRIMREYSKDRSVLNTFSYTGAFSIFASLGGAKSTVSIDLSKRNLTKTLEQYDINNISTINNKIIVEDIFNYFRYATRKKLKFDTVILDPPCFARSKKYKFSAAKDYPNLLKSAIDITKKNGVIIASTNCANFDMKKFKTFILAGFSGNESNYKILEEFRLPHDFRTIKRFPAGNYLKVLIIKKI